MRIDFKKVEMRVGSNSAKHSVFNKDTNGL